MEGSFTLTLGAGSNLLLLQTLAFIIQTDCNLLLSQEVLVLGTWTWCSVKLEPLLQDFMSQKHPVRELIITMKTLLKALGKQTNKNHEHYPN
jgi:hypothetical protein